jgi:hypothetical protein
MTKYSKGEWTNARYDICEIECDGEVYCTVATKDVDLIIRVLNENEDLKQSLSQTLRELRYGVKKVQRLAKENEELNQQRIDLLRLIENNIEIYENINTNVEFHKGEIQGKLTVLNNLRKVILND